MEYIEVSAKTVEDAISEAAIKLEVPSDKIEYEVITEGSTGFLGLIGSKPAVIKARKKFNLLDHTKDFLARMRAGMAEAQYIAGMGFSNVGLGIVRSMAHPLGAFYDTPHGVANATLLPYVMEYNAESPSRAKYLGKKAIRR